MAQQVQVNQQVVEAVRIANATVLQLGDELARTSARLATLHTCTMAVQDAASHLHHVSTVAVAAISVGLGRIAAGDGESGTEAIAAVEKVMATATEHLRQVMALAEQVSASSLTPDGQ